MQEANTGEQAKQTLERLLARDAVLRADLEFETRFGAAGPYLTWLVKLARTR